LQQTHSARRCLNRHQVMCILLITKSPLGMFEQSDTIQYKLLRSVSPIDFASDLMVTCLCLLRRKGFQPCLSESTLYSIPSFLLYLPKKFGRLILLRIMEGFIYILFWLLTGVIFGIMSIVCWAVIAAENEYKNRSKK